MTIKNGENLMPTVLALAAGVVSLVGFVFGTFFQGYVDKDQYHLLQESIRRRYDQTDTKLDEMSAKMEKARDKAQADRDELLSRVAKIEGRLR